MEMSGLLNLQGEMFLLLVGMPSNQFHLQL